MQTKFQRAGLIMMLLLQGAAGYVNAQEPSDNSGQGDSLANPIQSDGGSLELGLGFRAISGEFSV